MKEEMTENIAGYDPTECDKRIKAKKRIPCDSLQLPYHCDTLTGVGGDYHDECVDAGVIYFQVRVAECYNTKTHQAVYFPPSTFFVECNALNAKDPAWLQQWCYCCCACFAKDTLVAVPGGQAEIYTIPVGAEVLQASIDASGKPSWSPGRLKFSMGTGIGHQPMMVYIGFGKDQVNDLICTQDQPFLLANGKYITAGRLVPGDQLVNMEGNPVDIEVVSMGGYNGGVHHIAIDKPWIPGSPNGHLISTGGVVAGDFEFQLHFHSLHGNMKVAGHDQLPVIGTPEYDEKLQTADVIKSKVAFHFNRKVATGPDAGSLRPGTGTFNTYRRNIAPIPLGAQPLLRPAQAEDVLKNGEQTSFNDPMPQITFQTIKDQLTGFFPDILFYLDIFDSLPNVYAFEAYGKKIVQVSGGLARLIGMDYEGLAMAMGHGVGCFYGGKPTNLEGYSCVGQSDRFAFGRVCSKLWLGEPAFAYITNAIQQWELMFSLVNPDHAHGNPKDPLNDPSLACRTQVIESAPFGGGLPECAGGPAKKKLGLELANPVSLDQLVLTFNLALDPDGVDNPANYKFTPAVTIISAKRNGQRDFVVDITAKLEPKTNYTIQVKNLTSVLGTGLDPKESSAVFTTPDK